VKITNNTETKINLFWFRRDLRTDDNTGLFQALNAGLAVLPVFIFDTHILNRLKKDDPRIFFINQQLTIIKKTCEENGSSLKVMHGEPSEIFQQIISEYPVNAVYTNRDYEPYARQRDQLVKNILKTKGIRFFDYKDQIVFDTNEIVKENGEPYTVFTPYYRKWKSMLTDQHLAENPSQQLLQNLVKTGAFRMPTLEDIGFRPGFLQIPDFDISEKKLQNYAALRDFPAENGTSRLSVHLRFGTVSIRKVTRIALKISEKFVSELAWRNFYMDILWHFPRVAEQSFKPEYDRIVWRNDEAGFERWCNGETGYPLVDAGMHELNATGYMHNRTRMVTAGFLTKHLLTDWRWGEAYFAEKLLDFDLAANNGGWQWSAGSGCDAVPYFRVFNPEIQAKKFDPQEKYIRKWIQEYGTSKYPSPVINHDFARKRAMETYKCGLNRQ